MRGYDPIEERRVRAELELAEITVQRLNERLREVERQRLEQADLRVLEAQRDAQTWRPPDA